MTAPQPQREFAFTSGDFDYLRKYATGLTGIVLDEDKYNMVYARLARRVRQLGLSSFAGYCRYLETHPQTEVSELINAITTNHTSFFREQHHFDYLRSELLPQLQRRKSTRRRLRLWSAGCASGEEAWSIAITVAETIGTLAAWDVQVLGTDIDSRVLAQARDASYPAQALSALDGARRARWFAPDHQAPSGMLRVKPLLRELVTFRQSNLLRDWPVSGEIDAVFCRNVIIYFDTETKRRVVERFARCMHANSRLFLGHSESLFRVTSRFDALGGTIYRRAG